MSALMCRPSPPAALGGRPELPNGQAGPAQYSYVSCDLECSAKDTCDLYLALSEG